MTLVSKTFELYGKTYTFESGELAKQATGACLVKQGDTTMLDTVVVSIMHRADFAIEALRKYGYEFE